MPQDSHKKNRSRKEQAILEAAGRLFRRFGLKKVTVEDICREASASKMTFYKYYSNKVDVFKIFLTELYEGGFEEVEELKTLDIPFTQKIDRLLALKKRYVEGMSEELIDEILHLDESLGLFYRELTGRVLGRFVEFIRYSQDRGEVRRDMKPEFFLAAINILSEGLVKSEMHRMYSDYTEFALEVNRFIYYGILPMEKRGD